jgi:hypothetical protein
MAFTLPVGKPCRVERDRGLMCRDPQKKPLDFIREIRSPRAGDDDTEFALEPESHRCNADASRTDRIRRVRRPVPWFVCQPTAERLTDPFRGCRDRGGVSGAEHLDVRGVARCCQTRVGKVEMEHAEEKAQ